MKLSQSFLSMEISYFFLQNEKGVSRRNELKITKKSRWSSLSNTHEGKKDSAQVL
jgi:hypothetical protein